MVSARQVEGPVVGARWSVKIVEVVVRGILSLAILVSAVLAFRWMGSAEARPAPPRGDGSPAVAVAEAERHMGGIEFEVDGVVVPYRSVSIPAEVGGRVVYKSDRCRVGSVVQRGVVLLRIDARDYELEIRRLSEELEQAEGTLRELEVELTNGRKQIELAEEDLRIQQRELKRYETARDPGVFSRSEIDAARRAELTARNGLQTQQNQLLLLEARRRRLEGAKQLVSAQLEKAELDLQRTEITASMDGVITSEVVEQDDYVQKGSTIATLQDSSALDVTCSLYMQQMHWLWQSSSGEVAASPGAPALPATDRTADAYAFPTTPVKVSYRLGPREYLWDGRLDRYDGAGLDQQTRMVPCRVHVDSPLQVETVVAGVVMANAATVAPPTLMSGMFVQVRIHAQPDVPLLRLPNEALQPGNTVWVVREGRLHKCHVRVADMRDDRDHVLIYEDSGSPAAGDQVVSSPLSAPVEDMTVRVQSP